MNETDIYIKTPAGADELRTRTRTLPPRLRTMLIMVDGVARVGQLQQAAAALGAPADFMQTLEARGLVRLLAAAPVAAAAPATPAAPTSTPAAQPAAAAPEPSALTVSQALPEPSPPPAPLTTPRPPAPPVMLPYEVERFIEVRKFMNDTVTDALGLRGFLFTLKLEKCTTLDDLRSLLPEFGAAVMKARGELQGRTARERARGMLG